MTPTVRRVASSVLAALTIFSIVSMWMRFARAAELAEGLGRPVLAISFFAQGVVTVLAVLLVLLLLWPRRSDGHRVDVGAPTPPERFPRISPAETEWIDRDHDGEDKVVEDG